MTEYNTIEEDSTFYIERLKNKIEQVEDVTRMRIQALEAEVRGLRILIDRMMDEIQDVRLHR